MGLCSGGYSAFEVALWEKVDAVFAVNPRLTLYPAAKGTHVYTPDPARRHRARPTGGRAGPQAPDPGRRPVADLPPARGLARARSGCSARVVKRGTAVHVSACQDDAQHFTEVLFWRPFLARLRRNPQFVLEQDEVFDHSLLARAGQLATFERASAFLDRVAPL